MYIFICICTWPLTHWYLNIQEKYNLGCFPYNIYSTIYYLNLFILNKMIRLKLSMVFVCPLKCLTRKRWDQEDKIKKILQTEPVNRARKSIGPRNHLPWKIFWLQKENKKIRTCSLLKIISSLEKKINSKYYKKKRKLLLMISHTSKSKVLLINTINFQRISIIRLRS